MLATSYKRVGSAVKEVKVAVLPKYPPASPRWSLKSGGVQVPSRISGFGQTDNSLDQYCLGELNSWKFYSLLPSYI